MQFTELVSITGGRILDQTEDTPITILLTDSRKFTHPHAGVVFFAIRGARHDGHQFIEPLYRRGVRTFVVEEAPAFPLPDANVVVVDDSVRALQRIAGYHRQSMSLPVIGLTGSNGKTIVKEWLFQLLSPDFSIAKNPASYNSQIGVPLSVWQIRPHHTLGIFEAGISTVGEMEHLREVIRPTLGIFTNIGSAHDEGFRDRHQKAREKLALFRDADHVIYCKDHSIVDETIIQTGRRASSWGYRSDADIRVSREGARFTIATAGKEFTLHLPFSDQASIENALHCVAAMVHLGYSGEEIAARIGTLRTVPMRLELKEGIQGCQIIDDTYNNDLAGLAVSLDFLGQQRQKRVKRVILSDILQSGLPPHEWTKLVASLTEPFDHFVGIGPALSAHRHLLPTNAQVYASTGEFLREFDFSDLRDEIILVKGARVFEFERIVGRLQRKVHGTILEIDLGALVQNLNYFRSLLAPSTRIMAMVKAFAYGSGSIEIANVLQYHKIDYLGVAYADEGVELRNNNITLPIVVMNPDEDTFETLLAHALEPEVYGFRILDQLTGFLQGRPCNIHLKFDTGMHRLGFRPEDLNALATRLGGFPHVRVASVFSHLAGADESEHDGFTRHQAQLFLDMAANFEQQLGYAPVRHLINSSGVLRFPELQLDMVRLGIGLYGIDPTGGTLALRPVATLKTVISQIRDLQPGETIGYGRKGRADVPMRLATIAIGYADGFSRAFSQGRGEVIVNGHRVPVVGNVCMDMTMVDVTGIDAEEGDEVIVFGKDLPIAEMAQRIDTIPYEILARTSERVRRVFVAESL